MCFGSCLFEGNGIEIVRLLWVGLCYGGWFGGLVCWWIGFCVLRVDYDESLKVDVKIFGDYGV